MKLSEQWLRQWVSPKLNTAELAECLTMAGLEVDSIEPVAEKIEELIKTGKSKYYEKLKKKIQELISDNTIFIDTEGAVSGQINGLSANPAPQGDRLTWLDPSIDRYLSKFFNFRG